MADRSILLSCDLVISRNINHEKYHFLHNLYYAKFTNTSNFADINQ